MLPFSDVLNWSAFSLHIKESDIPKLKQILQSIPMDICISMQVHLIFCFLEHAYPRPRLTGHYERISDDC